MKAITIKDLTDRINALANKVAKLTAHLVDHNKDKGVVRAIKKAAANKRQLEIRLISQAKDTMDKE